MNATMKYMTALAMMNDEPFYHFKISKKKSGKTHREKDKRAKERIQKESRKRNMNMIEFIARVIIPILE